jgi:hypothetical protein
MNSTPSSRLGPRYLANVRVGRENLIKSVRQARLIEESR